MSIFLGRRMLLASKNEAVEGTAEVLANADANLLIYDVSFDPDIKMNKREPIAADRSPFSAIAGSRAGKITFKAELKGSGVAGTAPAIGKLLKSCGMAETVVAVTSATYDELTVGIPTATLAVYSLPESGNSIREQLRGARGKWKYAGKVGEIILLEFEFMGVMETVADVAALTATGLETTKPVPMLNAALSVQSFSPKCSVFSMDQGNTLELREDMGKAEGFVSAIVADGIITGSFDPEKETVAAHDYYGKQISGAEGALSMVLGAVAGNITTITAPKLQYMNVKPGVRGNKGIFTVDYQLNRNAGNDAVKIAFT